MRPACRDEISANGCRSLQYPIALALGPPSWMTDFHAAFTQIYYPSQRLYAYELNDASVMQVYVDRRIQ
jgi:hypothetical protein